MQEGKESKMMIKKQLQNCWNWLGINRTNELKEGKAVRENQRSVIQHFAPISVNIIPKGNTDKSFFEESVSLSKEELGFSKGRLKPLQFGGGNALISPDIADDIDSYLRWLEKNNALSFGYLSPSFQRNGLHGGMRQLLVDWMVQLKRSFSLVSETISLAVFILDRALLRMSKSITKENLQLLGTASLLIACKFEEIIVPRVDDFAYMSRGTFSGKEILRMEQSVLQALDYNFNCAHSIQFIRRYRFFMQTPKEVNNLAKFISEVPLVVYPLAHYKPSVVAAVSLYLAAFANGFPISSAVFSQFLHLDERDVISVASEFIPFVLELSVPTGKYHALYDNFKKVTKLPLSSDQVNRLKHLLD